MGSFASMASVYQVPSMIFGNFTPYVCVSKREYIICDLFMNSWDLNCSNCDTFLKYAQGLESLSLSELFFNPASLQSKRKQDSNPDLIRWCHLQHHCGRLRWRISRVIFKALPGPGFFFLVRARLSLEQQMIEQILTPHRCYYMNNLDKTIKEHFKRGFEGKNLG